MLTRAAASPVTTRLIGTLLTLALIGLAVATYGIFSAYAQMARLGAVDSAREAYVSLLKDMETSYRGYVISGETDFLEPFNTASKAIGPAGHDLTAAAQAAGVGEAEAAHLVSHQDGIVAYATRLIGLRGQSFEDSQALVKQRVGKDLMDAARRDSDALHGVTATGVKNSDYAVKRLYMPLVMISFVALAGLAMLLAAIIRKSREITARSRQVLSDVMERAPVGVALLDSKMQVAMMNAAFAQMSGGGRRLGASLTESAPTIGAHLQAKLRRALAPQASGVSEDVDTVINVENAAGTLSFKSDVFPLSMQGPDGRSEPGAGVVLTDVTKERQWVLELQDAKAEAEAANRAKSSFIANMSHELRTPLTAVLGYCELIEEDLRDLNQDGILADLNKISLNARHLLGLINDVLDLSKIEAQRMDVHAIDVDVASLLAEVEAATGSLISKNNNIYEQKISSQNFQAHTDDLKLKQILLNLIGNAAKFTSNGKISLQASKVEIDGVEQARFVVNDTGIGMSQEQVAGLFQRFSQADQTTTRKYGGTGLGLALTRALATMLGGTITVESVEGKGSSFTLTIPMRYVPPAVVPEVPVPELLVRPDAAATSKTGFSILVVDDEASAREMLTRHLTREGFHVETAVNGKEALAKIAARRPLAVMLDVLMPGLDGWHVLKAIRENPATADLPVIMQTVLDDQNFAYALGATSFLKKPVRRTDLASVLHPFAEVAAQHGTVLVVDDDVDAVDRLKAMLERDKWTVRIAHNGVEGLKAMKDKAPDLVLVDILMPEMDGHSFIHAVRQDSNFDAVPLVVLTAEDVRNARIRNLAPDTAAIVQKGSQPLGELVADLRRIADAGKTATEKKQ